MNSKSSVDECLKTTQKGRRYEPGGHADDVTESRRWLAGGGWHHVDVAVVEPPFRRLVGHQLSAAVVVFVRVRQCKSRRRWNWHPISCIINKHCLRTRSSAVAKRPCDCWIGQFLKCNWKRIFCTEPYKSTFNHCDVICFLFYRIRWNNAK